MPTFPMFVPIDCIRPRRAKRRAAAATPASLRILDRSLAEELVERFEQAVRGGRIELLDDDESSPAISLATFAAILNVLIPEEFPATPVKLSPATSTAPGTEDRIEVYRQRAARGEPVKRGDDADPSQDDRRNLRGSIRANGNMGPPKIDGWDEE